MVFVCFDKYSTTRIVLLIFIVLNLKTITTMKRHGFGKLKTSQTKRKRYKHTRIQYGYYARWTEMNEPCAIYSLHQNTAHKTYKYTQNLFPLSLHLIFLLCFEIDILTSFMLQNLETFPFVTLLVQFVRQYRLSFLIEFFDNNK